MVNSKVESDNSKVESVNFKVKSVNSKVVSVNSKVESVNFKVKSVNSKVESVNSKVESVNSKVESVNSKVQEEVSKLKIGFEIRLNDTLSPIGIRIKRGCLILLRQPPLTGAIRLKANTHFSFLIKCGNLNAILAQHGATFFGNWVSCTKSRHWF
jgi:hypothetical protein